MDWAAKYIGLRFAERGRGPRYDCWGLHRLVTREVFGVQVPSYADDYQRWDDVHLPALMIREARKWQPVALGEELPGDVALFRIYGRPNHIGTVVTPGQMLHITRGIDACIESYLKPLWRPRLVGIYR